MVSFGQFGCLWHSVGQSADGAVAETRRLAPAGAGAVHATNVAQTLLDYLWRRHWGTRESSGNDLVLSPRRGLSGYGTHAGGKCLVFAAQGSIGRPAWWLLDTVHGLGRRFMAETLGYGDTFQYARRSERRSDAVQALKVGTIGWLLILWIIFCC